MSKKFEHTVISENSNRYVNVEKDNSSGPYSKKDRIAQALEYKKSAIKEQWEREGRKATHDEVCREAAKIAEHRDKMFKG